jgi:hypothetical protein
MVLMNNELENIRKEAVMAYFRHYPDVRQEVMKKTTKTVSQHSLSPDQVSNP